MKLKQIFETEDDLNSFRNNMLNRVKAHVQTNQAMVGSHDWKFNIGDLFLSTKTGKTYKLTGRTFQKVVYGPDHKKLPQPRLVACYYYETTDGEKGTMREQALVDSTTMKCLTTQKRF